MPLILNRNKTTNIFFFFVILRFQANVQLFAKCTLLNLFGIMK